MLSMCNFETATQQQLIENRQNLIEATQFTFFLNYNCIYLEEKYIDCEKLLIKYFLKILNMWQYRQLVQVKYYTELLNDYLFWESR